MTSRAWADTALYRRRRPWAWESAAFVTGALIAAVLVGSRLEKAVRGG